MHDSDLSGEEWQLIEHHFQPKDRRGADACQARCRQRDSVSQRDRGAVADVAQGLSSVANGV